MNVLDVLTGLVLLLAAAYSQAPEPCVSPPLMTGGFTFMTSDSMVSTGTVSYDAFGQRMRVRSFGLMGNGTSDQMMFFSKGYYYDIDWSRFSCKKRRLNADFVPMRVPSDAKLMGQVIMGSSSSWGMGVLTNTWYGTMPGNVTYSAVFTEIGCIPMTYSYHTPATGWLGLSTFNWVLGNTNPMDFHPPFICAKAQLEETQTPENMFTIMKSQAQRMEE